MAKNYYWILIVLMSVAGKVFSKASWCAVAGLLATLAPTARAILSGSTIAPGSPPWNYVGSIGGLSGVYLGDYNGTNWVLTAAHVGSGSFTLGGTTYPAAGSVFSITNSTSTYGEWADLTLFQISGTPGLANLPVAFSEPSPGTSVQMIGFGGGKSWGTNTIWNYANYTLSGYPYGGPGIVTLASGESGNGAQGESGDSGGGLFAQSSGTWYLAGILSGVGDITNSDNVNLGPGTIAVDFAAYYSQIAADINSVSSIPEPSTYAAIAGLGALLAGVIYRRRVVHH